MKVKTKEKQLYIQELKSIIDLQCDMLLKSKNKTLTSSELFEFHLALLFNRIKTLIRTEGTPVNDNILKIGDMELKILDKKTSIKLDKIEIIQNNLSYCRDLKISCLEFDEYKGKGSKNLEDYYQLYEYSLALTNKISLKERIGSLF